MKRASNKYLNFILWRAWDVWHLFAGITASIKTQIRFLCKPDQKPHNLSAPLIVSLTSYPPRFGALSLTLKSLLTQTVQPDKVILWIAEKDIPLLPSNITELSDRGLQIKSTNDTGPYKKLVPALIENPQAFIVTADDDIYYKPEWLENILTSWSGSNKEIIGYRGSYMTIGADGRPLPYGKWDPKDHHNDQRPFFITGGAGCLYPPGSLAADVVNDKKFMVLCPNTDDIWFYWMGRCAGSSHKKVLADWTMINWPSTQKSGLYHQNVVGLKNDLNISNMIDAYGWPPAILDSYGVNENGVKNEQTDLGHERNRLEQTGSL